MKLHPVIGHRAAAVVGRTGVAEGRRLGRLCLARSLRLVGAPHPPPTSGDSAEVAGLPEFPRNSAGAPQPYQAPDVPDTSWFWSTTNTHGLAGGVVAPHPVALDAEWLERPRLDAVRAYFDEAELELLTRCDAPPELVLWTAKEAVLKLTGLGLAGLPRCRLSGPGVSDTLDLELDGRRFAVRSAVQGEHVLAFACAATDVTWQLHVLAGVPA